MGRTGWRAGSCSTQFRDTQGGMTQEEVVLGIPGDWVYEGAGNRLYAMK